MGGALFWAGALCGYRCSVTQQTSELRNCQTMGHGVLHKDGVASANGRIWPQWQRTIEANGSADSGVHTDVVLLERLDNNKRCSEDTAASQDSLVLG
jgi:hypothetical protein